VFFAFEIGSGTNFNRKEAVVNKIEFLIISSLCLGREKTVFAEREEKVNTDVRYPDYGGLGNSLVYNNKWKIEAVGGFFTASQGE
jgi:hypothetical protein